MKKFTFSDGKKNYHRVTKKAAAKAYQNGERVVMVACNLCPFGIMHPECVLNRKCREDMVMDEIGVANDFKNQVVSCFLTKRQENTLIDLGYGSHPCFQAMIAIRDDL